MKKVLPIILLIAAVVAAIVIVAFVIQGDVFNAPLRINATVILERVQNMSALVTTRYSNSSMVTSEREMPGILSGLYGESMAMVAVGYVTAGIDLSKLTEDDVEFENGVISLRLPTPELQDCFLNEQDSYIVSYNTGIFARNLPNIDIEARRFAIHKFRDAAPESGILDEAQNQAKVALEEFINLVSSGDITGLQITLRESSETVFPDSCA
jgi:hypothetical protein